MFNVIGTRPGSDKQTATGSLIKTISAVFPNLAIYTSYPSELNRPQNFIVIARKDGKQVTLDPSLQINEEWGSGRQSFTLKEMRVSRDEIVTENDVILTDDHSPIERLIVEEMILGS